MFRRQVVLALLLVVAVALIGCSSAEKGTTTTTNVSESKDPYVIGAIFSTTGDNAPLGVPEQETVEMLIKQINKDGGVDGHQIKVDYYDDEGKPEQAVQACQKLLAKKGVIAIIGPTLSGPSLAIKDACQNAGMPNVSCAASVKIVEPVEKYVFKTAQTDSLAVAKLLDYIKAKSIKTVGFINDSNAFGASGRDQWTKLADAAGIKTVAMESFNTSDTTMTSQLTKIKAQNPDAVVCWGTNPGPAIVAKDMQRLKMTQPLLMSHGIANMQFIKLAGSAANGVVFPAGKLLVADAIPGTDPQKQVLLDYRKSYEKAYGKGPNTFGGHAWDALMLVVDAAKSTGADKAKMADALQDTKDFVGISGVFDMSAKDHTGLTKDAFAMVKIQDGKWVLAQ